MQQQALIGMEKHNRLKDLGAQKVILPCLFHVQFRFEAAQNSGTANLSLKNLNSTEIRVL